MRDVVRAIGSRRSRLGRRRFVRALGAILLVTIVSVAMPQSAMLQSPTPPRDSAPAGETPTEAPVVLSTKAVPMGIQSVIQLPAAADTYIASGMPTQNFGTSTSLFLGYDLADYSAQRFMIIFDVLSAIPPNATINSATLELTLSYCDPSGDAPMGTDLLELASGWDEYAVTWDYEPNWGAVRDTAYVSCATLSTQNWDVTSLVADWVDGTLTNYGMEVIGDERVQERQRAFFSRESSVGPTPHLIVDYTIINDTLPPVVTVNALPEYSPRTFEVSWSGYDQAATGEVASGIAYYDVQIRINGGSWSDWHTGATYTSASYVGQNGYLYEFRARGVDNAGNVEAYGGAQASTTVDINPPVTQMTPLPPIQPRGTTSFLVSWSGTDSVSGIAYFNVYVSFDDGPFMLWLPKTLATSDTYVPDQGDGVYRFEVNAVDGAGLIEPLGSGGKAATAIDNVPPFIVPAVWFPIIFHQ